METTALSANYLLGGAINGAILALVAYLLSRYLRESIGRVLLAVVLVAAGGFYVGFAVTAGAGPGWVALELTQAGILATFAVLGLRRSPYWLAAGWALHPFWDIPLHLWGPGHAFAPEAYAVSCLTYDWVVALYVLIAYTATGTPRFRNRRSVTMPARQQFLQHHVAQ
ncbi:DUF6010 family protein [Kocuria arenosa]|uniref:DUF6010 family protein n=1 Tax=Kocuria arenosa TaxID=3071446 RepID=UPI0034D6ABAC